MAGQLWATSSLGGILYSPKLSRKLRYAAQPLLRFRQFCDVKDAFGKNKGDTVNWEKIANISTQGGTLVETSTMPERNYTIVKGTLTVTEYGNAIPLTRKVDELSEFEMTDMVEKSLKNDMVKVMDTAVEAQFDACKIRYVGSSSTTYALTTDGTATATNTSTINQYHIKNIVDYLRRDLVAAPFDNDGNYVGLVTTRTLRNVYDNLETTAMYTQFPLAGEVGKYYDVRFVRDIFAMDDTIGSGTPTGEGYFFGEETVMEAVSIAEEVISKIPTDYGRSKGIAWYFIGGWKIMWEGDPDNKIIKWDSKA